MTNIIDIAPAQHNTDQEQKGIKRGKAKDCGPLDPTASKEDLRQQIAEDVKRALMSGQKVIIRT